MKTRGYAQTDVLSYKKQERVINPQNPAKQNKMNRNSRLSKIWFARQRKYQNLRIPDYPEFGTIGKFRIIIGSQRNIPGSDYYTKEDEYGLTESEKDYIPF